MCNFTYLHFRDMGVYSYHDKGTDNPNKPERTRTMAKDIKEITEQLEKGVKEVFESEKYKAYLEFMGKFYDYSFNNIMLILMQNPNASLVAGYKAWQTKFKRQVKKGEKGITIIAPCPHKYKKEVEDDNGNLVMAEFNYTTYRACTVFDISQTDGEAVPTLTSELTGTVIDFTETVEKLQKLSPVPVEFEEIEGQKYGYFSPANQKIAVKAGISEVHTVKTLVHEIAHAKLHDKGGEEEEATRRTQEVQAESVAYTVCHWLGLDTSDYSFSYVAGWSEGKEVKELNASMEVIRKTAKEIIDGLRAA